MAVKTLLVAKNLSTLRHRAGLYQLDVARHVGVTQQQVSYWERGMALRRIEHLQRLADLFGVAPERVIGRRAR